MKIFPRLTELVSGLRRPLSGLGLWGLILILATVPAVLYFDTLDNFPDNFVGKGYIPREPLASYRLWSDDVAFAGVGRSWHRTLNYLFVPHNTHVVPVWRVLMRLLVATAGKLEKLPDVLAVASYSILVAVMLMLYRIVTRETGRAFLGLVAMILVGTTSLMLTPVIWFSAGQPLWAGFGILSTLWYAQSFRRTGRAAHLILAGVAAIFSGWCWTIGHMAGPVAAIYLWVDGRPRCRTAAVAPVLATILAVILSAGLGFRYMDSTISFHGRTALEAVNPARGVTHTGQSIPENLVLGNLGLHADTTATQGAILTLLLIATWVWCRRDCVVINGQDRWRLALNPLECAGATLVIGSYVVEWAFRGYLDFELLRTIALRALVPWYDAIPQIGAVLFVVGWWSGPWHGKRAVRVHERFGLPRRGTLNRGEAWGLLSISLLMFLLNSPRVEDLVRRSVPALTPPELKGFAVPHLQTMRANALLTYQADWQRVALRRLDRAEESARRMGIGRDAIRAAFGHPFLVGSFAIKPPLELLGIYDSAALLDLPETGRHVEPAAVRAAFGDFFVEDPEPRPNWLGPDDSWPPPPVDPRTKTK